MIQFTKKRVAMKVLNRYEKGLKKSGDWKYGFI